MKKWTVKKFIKELVSTLILFFLLSTVVNYLRKPDITENIYDYKLLDSKGEEIFFSSYKDKPLLVHFWATWCPTCKLEASNIEQVSQKYNVVSIAIKSENIQKFMKIHKLTYKVIDDKEGTLAKSFNIGAYPTTLIYNAKGELKFTEVGYSTTLGLEARLALIQ